MVLSYLLFYVISLGKVYCLSFIINNKAKQHWLLRRAATCPRVWYYKVEGAHTLLKISKLATKHAGTIETTTFGKKLWSRSTMNILKTFGKPSDTCCRDSWADTYMLSSTVLVEHNEQSHPDRTAASSLLMPTQNIYGSSCVVTHWHDCLGLVYKGLVWTVSPSCLLLQYVAQHWNKHISKYCCRYVSICRLLCFQHCFQLLCWQQIASVDVP